jgi:hypothetical protein
MFLSNRDDTDPDSCYLCGGKNTSNEVFCGCFRKAHRKCLKRDIKSRYNAIVAQSANMSVSIIEKHYRICEYCGVTYKLDIDAIIYSKNICMRFKSIIYIIISCVLFMFSICGVSYDKKSLSYFDVETQLNLFYGFLMSLLLQIFNIIVYIPVYKFFLKKIIKNNKLKSEMESGYDKNYEIKFILLFTHIVLNFIIIAIISFNYHWFIWNIFTSIITTIIFISLEIPFIFCLYIWWIGDILYECICTEGHNFRMFNENTGSVRYSN